MTRRLDHGGAIGRITFSPDSRRILAVGEAPWTCVWDATTGANTAKLKHNGVVEWAEWSPDGRWIVTASADRTARVWDAASGTPVTQPLEHEQAVHGASFSPDGRLMLTRTGSASARLWDLPVGRLRCVLDDSNNGIGPCAFSPDSRLVVAKAHLGHHVWDVATGKRRPPALYGDTVASFSPDGRLIGTAGDGGDVWLYAAEALTDHPRQLPRQGSRVVDICFSADSRRLATACADGTARVWDITSLAPVTQPIHHSGAVRQVSLSLDSSVLMTLDSSDHAQLWDLAVVSSPDSLLGEAGNVKCVAFSADGRHAATGSFDGLAQLWERKGGEFRQAGPPLVHRRRIDALALSPDGSRLVTISRSAKDTQRLWDPRDGRLVASLPCGDVAAFVAFSQTGNRLFTTDARGVSVWDPVTGRALARMDTPINRDREAGAVISRDGGWLLTTTSDFGATRWDTRNGQRITDIAIGRQVAAVALSPDGRTLASATGEQRVDLRDAHSGRLLRSLRHNDTICSLSFSRDGRFLATGMGARGIRRPGKALVWDVSTGRAVGRPLPHHSCVTAASFSPDGRYVVTGSTDLTARAWETATGEPVSPPFLHLNEVTAAQFITTSPGQPRQILTLASRDGAQIWNLPEACHPASSTHHSPLTTHRSLPTARNLLRAWHEREAGLAAASRKWAASLRHLDPLIAAEPADRQWRLRRARAHAELGNWAAAKADHTRARSAGAKVVVMTPFHSVEKNPSAGLRCQGRSEIVVYLPGPARRFTTSVRTQADAAVPADQIGLAFSVRVGGRDAYRSPVLRPADPPHSIEMDLKGASAFVLETSETGRYGVQELGFWEQPCVEMEDGTTLRLGDLPLFVIDEL